MAPTLKNLHMMTSIILQQFAILACIIIYASIYLTGIRQGRVKPILATWMFLSLASALSFVTNFFETGIGGIGINSFNLIDSTATLIIFLVVARNKNVRKRFTRFEKMCLGVVALIFIGWLVSGQNVIAHLCIQAILIIAYLPTLAHLWRARQNTESLSMWFFDFLGSAIGLIEPLRTLSFLPLVYTIRSALSALAVMTLILRLQYRKS